MNESTETTRRRGTPGTLPLATLLAGILAAGGSLAGEGPLDAALGHLEPLPAATLDESHGKAALQVDRIQINNQEVTGVLTDNVATNNQTGDNTVGGDAFAGSTGFMTTIQNTGNNVLIQNSTIINVAVEE